VRAAELEAEVVVDLQHRHKGGEAAPHLDNEALAVAVDRDGPAGGQQAPGDRPRPGGVQWLPVWFGFR
jgi:hypothetical protein